MSKIITVQRHLVESQALHPSATGDLTALLWDLTLAFKVIARAVRKAGLLDVLGQDEAVDSNASGDTVMKLDRYAQDTIYRAMDHGGHLCCMASEEEQELIPIPDKYPKGKYALSFDPLDGSSNIDVNVSVGTIFSITQRVSPEGTPGVDADVLQKGRELVAAGYVIYGSSTMLVYSTGQGVHGFTLDAGVGEFLLSHPNIRIPERGTIYSTNEGNSAYWDQATRDYVDFVKSPESGAYKSRYIGSMIADVHRTLLYGGIFLYPKTYRKDPVNGECKLRLIYEAAPMAAIVEQAGGIATTGDEALLDLTPTSLHERCPVIMGSPANVKEYLEFYRGERR